MPLFILHYPVSLAHHSSATLKLLVDINAIIGLNENETRVRYRTTTRKGSSGAPCFTADWRLIALNHAGGPDCDKKKYTLEYNQGILFSAIVNLLENRGKLSSLGAQNKEQHSGNSSSQREPDAVELHSEKPEVDELSPYEQACKYFREAVVCLQKACELLREELHIPIVADFQL